MSHFQLKKTIAHFLRMRNNSRASLDKATSNYDGEIDIERKMGKKEWVWGLLLRCIKKIGKWEIVKETKR